MSNVRYKTTGQLIDELITTGFKQEINNTDELRLKTRLLTSEIAKTLAQNTDKAEEVLKLKAQLVVVSRRCWEAQEIVMAQESPTEVAWAAITAQETNAGRNQYIRLIDSILGESNTVTEKTYG